MIECWYGTHKAAVCKSSLHGSAQFNPPLEHPVQNEDFDKKEDIRCWYKWQYMLYVVQINKLARTRYGTQWYKLKKGNA